MLLGERAIRKTGCLLKRTKTFLNPNTVTLRSYAHQQAIHVMGIMQCGSRLYDPVLGRFLSPDPSVADPSTINPYSYFPYNPLSGLDTSGFFLKGIFQTIAKPVVKHFKNVVKVAEKVVSILRKEFGLTFE